MKITKALITAAGFGTRFLPITKTIQKELLPILDAPIIDYVVDDLIGAGVTDIYFVISEHNRQLLHYYRENPRLHRYLLDHKKEQLYELVKHLHTKATFHFITQKDSDEYGTAVPLKLAKEFLENDEAFFVFMGDDVVFNRDRISESAKMISCLENSQAVAVATCVPKPQSELSRYGVIKTVTQGNHDYLESIVEKPELGTEPSNLVNISKYILTNKIFSILAKQSVNPSSGELYITDTITSLAKSEKVAIYTPSGEYLDGGNPTEWLKANITVALQRSDTKDEIASFMKKCISHSP